MSTVNCLPAVNQPFLMQQGFLAYPGPEPSRKYYNPVVASGLFSGFTAAGTAPDLNRYLRGIVIFHRIPFANKLQR